MRPWQIFAAYLALLGCPPCLEGHQARETKAPAVDMRNLKQVFLGWVDLSPDQWRTWGYESREEWVEIIKDLNLGFLSSCQSKYMTDRTVVGAKGKTDEGSSDYDLYVKFSNVGIDQDFYGIRLSIHFIDPKTNSEIATVPSRLYFQKRWFRFQLYMRAALDEVGKVLQREISRRR